MAFIHHLIDRFDSMHNVILTAKHLGTYEAMDRSRQYQDDDPKKLRDQVNNAFYQIRANQKAIATKDEELAELRHKVSHDRIIIAVLSSIITALAWKGLEAVTAYFFS